MLKGLKSNSSNKSGKYSLQLTYAAELENSQTFVFSNGAHLCEFEVLKLHSVLIARRQKPDTCKFGLVRLLLIQLPLLKNTRKSKDNIFIREIITPKRPRTRRSTRQPNRSVFVFTKVGGAKLNEKKYDLLVKTGNPYCMWKK